MKLAPINLSMHRISELASCDLKTAFEMYTRVWEKVLSLKGNLSRNGKRIITISPSLLCVD